MFPLLSMIYPLALGTAFIIAGLLLLVAHGLALFKPKAVQDWLRAFPRSRFWGTAMIVAATVWAWLLVTKVDLGEFSDWRFRLQLIVPIAGFLAWQYVDEFLSVRALGMVTLLAAEPLLEAAWLHPEGSRLVLVVLVYAYIVLAMFWIGMPYVLRDQIAWLTKNESRWRAAALAGVIYGALLLILVPTLHRSS